jgi:hypothetical protein
VLSVIDRALCLSEKLLRKIAKESRPKKLPKGKDMAVTQEMIVRKILN